MPAALFFLCGLGACAAGDPGGGSIELHAQVPERLAGGRAYGLRSLEEAPVVAAGDRVRLHAAPDAPELELIRLRWQRQLDEPAGERSVTPHDVLGWVPDRHELPRSLPVGSDRTVVLPPDLADGAYCLRAPSDDAALARDGFHAPCVVGGLAELGLEVEGVRDGPGLRLTLRVRNDGSGAFAGGHLVVTLQRVAERRPVFQGRDGATLPPIPAGGSHVVELDWETSELEPGRFYFAGHAHDAGVHSDGDFLVEFRSERFAWQ